MSAAGVEAMDELSWFARALQLAPPARETRVMRVVTDSREVRPGDLFVALRGERFDAHDFVASAARMGAVAALVDQPVPDAAVPMLCVADTLAALQQLARAWRQRFSVPVIAVTGSNGKTTTKQLLASVCAARGAVLATRGNLNNHIGLPLTLLELRAMHRSAVIEMGANHLGEIAQLTAITQPDVGVITQAGDAHLEGFGSREGVARGKGELFAGLPAHGIAAINVDDAFAPLWRDLARGRQIGFGLHARADVRAEAITADAQGSRFTLVVPGGQAAVRLPLAGRHNVMNALAAAACGVAIGLDADVIAEGLSRVQGAQGRVSWKRATQGARVIDDSYNANPTSMQAGLELLAQQPAPRWAVLGAMAELGAQSGALHEACARHARVLGIEHLLALQPAAADYARGFGAGARAFEDVDALNAVLQAELTPDATVLVKGSRSARMERVVIALCGAETGRETH